MRDEQPEDKKKEIKQMIEQIESEKMIELIYWFVRRGYKEERGSDPRSFCVT